MILVLEILGENEVRSLWWKLQTISQVLQPLHLAGSVTVKKEDLPLLPLFTPERTIIKTMFHTVRNLEKAIQKNYH
jgi:hypothetical protein